MDVVIEVPTMLRIEVDDVAHPVHAVNRLRKYFRHNIVSVDVDTLLGYVPEGNISIKLDQTDLIQRLDVEEHVVEPSVWLDKADIEQIVRISWMLDEPVSERLQKLIEKYNTV
jgi:hypothetical protein